MADNKRKFTPAEQAILTTILYSDIFAFPITEDELWQLLISNEKITKEAFKLALHNLLTRHSGLSRISLIYKDGYYCLSGKEAIIAKRKQNLGEVTKKLSLAKKIIPQLAAIPTISFIGISGGLAVGNALKNDDIDLFLIVKKETLFFSRFAVLCVLQLLGRRRKRGQQHASDMFCVNFLIDDTRLAWPSEKRDVYTAREIAQVVPMFERGEMYTAFLSHNVWITKFLPNSLEKKKQVFLQHTSTKEIVVWSILEKILRFIQLSYMKSVRTTEVVTNHSLAFHPNDYRSQISDRLRLKMRQLGLLTKI